LEPSLHFPFLYFEFRRLHDDSTESAEVKVPFSVWKWLYQESSATDYAADDILEDNRRSPQHHNQHDDALFVLGVAGLASKRLLQKHHITTTEASAQTKGEHASTVAPTQRDDVLSVSNRPIDVGFTSVPMAAVAVTETFVQTLSRILASRQLLMQYQREKIQAVIKLMIHGPIRMARSLWKFGGGTHTISRTVSVTLAFVLVSFRMLSYLLSSDGLNMTNGGA
jgi:hypothetical protein